MNDEDGFDVSRRTLLYGLVTAGLGAGTGAVTAAELNDSVMFGDGRFATQTTGTLELNVTPKDINLDIPNGKDTSKSGSITVSVPEQPDGSQNNPARVWFRTNCPVGKELEDKLELTVGYDGDCDGTVDRTIRRGPLSGLRESLREDPVLLDGNPGSGSNTDPLEVGDQICLNFELERTEGLDSGETIEQTLELAVEFYAEQARYTPRQPPESWEDVSCNDPSNSMGISFVAFCRDGGFSNNNTFTVETATDEDGDPITNGEDEPLAVDWESDEQVDSLVLKTGGGPDELYTFGVYDTEGTTRLAVSGSNSGSGQSPSSPCPDGTSGVKYEYCEDGSWAPDEQCSNGG